MSVQFTSDFQPSLLLDMDAAAAMHALLVHAMDSGASDLFLMSDENAWEVAIRYMGRMQRVAMLPAEQGRHIASYVRTCAMMDISEQRRPQEGRWLASIEDRHIDLRVDCIPTLFGLDLSLRLWDRDVGLRKLDELGLSQLEYNRLSGMLEQRGGLLIVTGPNGTGKTTTLYACIQHLNNGHRKINTLEDPVEFAIDGVRQSQVSDRLKVSYADLLPHVLRQAPDVVMIGEIRDKATAGLAVQAANAGQLVLTSVSAPVAVNAIHNLLALGAHPHFLSTGLLGVVAQRLVRRLCPNCRVFYDVSESPETFAEIADILPPDQPRALYGPGGCEQCHGTGFAGRVGLFEILTMSKEVRALIADGTPRVELEAAARRAGMIEFRRAAMVKVANGLTSFEEILGDVPSEYLGLEE